MSLTTIIQLTIKPNLPHTLCLLILILIILLIINIHATFLLVDYMNT